MSWVMKAAAGPGTRRRGRVSAPQGRGRAAERGREVRCAASRLGLDDHRLLEQRAHGVRGRRAHCGRQAGVGGSERSAERQLAAQRRQAWLRCGTSSPCKLAVRRPASAAGRRVCCGLRAAPAALSLPTRTRQPLLDGGRVERGLLGHGVVPAPQAHTRAAGGASGSGAAAPQAARSGCCSSGTAGSAQQLLQQQRQRAPAAAAAPSSSSRPPLTSPGTRAACRPAARASPRPQCGRRAASCGPRA